MLLHRLSATEDSKMNSTMNSQTEFHLFSFAATAQQKCLECQETGSSAYLRTNVFTVMLAYSIKHFSNAVFVAIFRTGSLTT